MTETEASSCVIPHPELHIQPRLPKDIEQIPVGSDAKLFFFFLSSSVGWPGDRGRGQMSALACGRFPQELVWVGGWV